jgi:hypothetical protein
LNFYRKTSIYRISINEYKGVQSTTTPFKHFGQSRLCQTLCERRRQMCGCCVGVGCPILLLTLKRLKNITRPFSPAGSCTLKTKSNPRVVDEGVAAIVRQFDMQSGRLESKLYFSGFLCEHVLSINTNCNNFNLQLH